jgi:hypothetical protein
MHRNYSGEMPSIIARLYEACIASASLAVPDAADPVPEDAQRRLGSKLIQEFKFHPDIKALCKELCELEHFRCFTPKQLQEIFEDARKGHHQAQITSSPYVGQPIFGGHFNKG